MTKILALINLADQFLKDRDWWQFHNPKNDSINLVVEVGELAELFIESEQDERRERIQEMEIWISELMRRQLLICW